MENRLAKSIDNYKGKSELLELRLHQSLCKAEDFYYSDFWTSRFKRKAKNFDIEEIDISVIQGYISELLEDVYFRMINEDATLHGSSINCRISINTNLTLNEVNDSHIHNLVMHEFGHIMYSHIPILEKVNKDTIGDPRKHLTQPLEGEDLIYFTDANELRLRIIPIVREMYDNDWTLEETYFKSPNLIQDTIYKLYSKEYVIHLIANII